MDPLNKNEKLSYLKVTYDALIEDVAEDVLSQSKPVGVINNEQKLIGLVHSSKVLSILFGKRDNSESKNV